MFLSFCARDLWEIERFTNTSVEKGKQKQKEKVYHIYSSNDIYRVCVVVVVDSVESVLYGIREWYYWYNVNSLALLNAIVTESVCLLFWVVFFLFLF